MPTCVLRRPRARPEAQGPELPGSTMGDIEAPPRAPSDKGAEEERLRLGPAGDIEEAR